jgi:homocysteine S-methyltransferase
MTYRDQLPQLSDSRVFLTDGGLETDLIFNEGFEMPLFASFPLLDTQEGYEALRRYYQRFAQVAQEAHAGFIFEACTWRASREWGCQLGYSPEALADVNRRAIQLLIDLRDEMCISSDPMVISAAIGPQRDAYRPDLLGTPEEAQAYHSEQIETLATTDVDLVNAMTITNGAEAIGIVRAAQEAGLPASVSFTVETDGSLPDGSSLSATIHEVDEATQSAAAYFGINCAHPTHFDSVLATGTDWGDRIQLIRANASRMSHAQLDQAPELDDGDPMEFGGEYARIRERFPHINVLGGCCGTDIRHLNAIARMCL